MPKPSKVLKSARQKIEDSKERDDAEEVEKEAKEGDDGIVSRAKLRVKEKTEPVRTEISETRKEAGKLSAAVKGRIDAAKGDFNQVGEDLAELDETVEEASFEEGELDLDVAGDADLDDVTGEADLEVVDSGMDDSIDDMDLDITTEDF